MQTWQKEVRCLTEPCKPWQILEAREESVTKMKYDHDKLEEAGTAYFHELGELEARERWCRIWCARALSEYLSKAFEGVSIGDWTA